MNIGLILKTKFLIIACIIVSSHCGTCQVSDKQDKFLNDKNYNLKTCKSRNTRNLQHYYMEVAGF